LAVKHFVGTNQNAVKWVTVMVFNATFNNISAISWRSVLLVKENGYSARRKPPTCHKLL